MAGQRIGYLEVSTLDPNEKRQLEGLVLDRAFTDREPARPQFTELPRFAGDTLVVHSMDRLARNLDDLHASVQGLTRKAVRVEFVKEGLVFTGEDSPMANLMLSVMGPFAEVERSLIRERQREGIALAKQRGVYKERKKTLTPERATELIQRADSGVPKAVFAVNTGSAGRPCTNTSANGRPAIDPCRQAGSHGKKLYGESMSRNHLTAGSVKTLCRQ